MSTSAGARPPTTSVSPATRSSAARAPAAPTSPRSPPPPTTSYSDTTAAAGTSYSYRVRANDAATNLGPYTNTATATTPVPSGPTPVAAYAFDEGSGSTVADASGNGNNGTVANTTWAAAGKYGKAFSFNGTSSRVTVPDSASLHLSSAMTLEAWVNPATTTAAWRDVIYKGNDNYYLEGTSDHGGRPGRRRHLRHHVYGTSALPLNTWSYLAVTYDRTTIRLYVNGTQVSTLAATGAIASSTNPLTIGSDPLYGQYFSGLIDDVRVYNTALTQAQIQTDMTTPVAPPAPDTSPPSAPGTLSATAISGSRVDLSWGAATDNVGVTGYRVERCQGAGCSNFAQIAHHHHHHATATPPPRRHQLQLPRPRQRRRHQPRPLLQHRHRNNGEHHLLDRRHRLRALRDGGVAGQRRRRSQRQQQRPVHVQHAAGRRRDLQRHRQDATPPARPAPSPAAPAPSPPPTSPTSPSPARTSFGDRRRG